MQSALTIRPVNQPVALRDIASVLFRHKRTFVVYLCIFLAATVLVAFLLPRQYRASAKILVEHQRPDNTLSPEGQNTYQGPPSPVTEADLESEIELMQTDDILQHIVVHSGLAGRHPSTRDIDRAAERLHNALLISPIKESNIIDISYRSGNPQRAADVVNTLLDLYLQKHLQISGANKEYRFFDNQVALYKSQLDQFEKQLAAANVVSPALARDQMINKQADMRAEMDSTSSAIASTQDRIDSLQKLEGTTPRNVVTEEKTQDNPQLLQDMKGTLLKLELQRDQLLSKYQPTYRPVIELNKQIADAQAAIARQTSEPLREKTVAQSGAYDWIRTDLAKSQAELQGLLGKQRAEEEELASTSENLHSLNQSAIAQQALTRQAKSAEANYLFYLQKREEVRVSAALNEKKLFNIAVVQSASVPALPLHQRGKILVVGFLASGILSIAVVFLADLFDPRFRSLRELATSLDVPILAAIPYGHNAVGAISPSLQNSSSHDRVSP